MQPAEENIAVDYDRLSGLSEGEARQETEKLRGAVAFTSYKGILIPKNGLEKKDPDADDDGKKKKLIFLALGLLAAYYFLG